MPPVHHLAIQVRDLHACERFYREVLGLPVLRRWAAEGGGERAVWLDLGRGAFLALEAVGGGGAGGGSGIGSEIGQGFGEGAGARAGGSGSGAESGAWRDSRAGYHLLALAIAPGERASWEARLAAAGVAVVHRTRWTSYVFDPEGNRIGLSHHPEDPA